VPLMGVSGFGLSTAEDMACLKRVFWKNRDDLKDDRDRKMNCREIFLQLGSDLWRHRQSHVAYQLSI
jgi:hypothetical protein